MRLANLVDFARRLINGEDGRGLIQEHEDVLSTVTPAETMQVLDSLLVSGVPLETVKTNVGKILNVFFKSLNAYRWEKPGEGHFLHYLMLENREAEKILTEVKSINKVILKKDSIRDQSLISRLKSLMIRLKEYELHYLKKENILFPHIERVFPEYRCLQIMWSFHDDFRHALKRINLILEAENPDYDLLNKETGKLFFVVLPVIFREEQILFPVAIKAIPRNSWDEMMTQSYEQGWCYVQPPDVYRKKVKLSGEGMLNPGSGNLTPEQIRLLFNSLPVDITFIDENDEVKFFSESKERIFPRSASIIGRKVQNCHPPQSVHTVNEIIAAFRNGTEDHADFWIHIKERLIFIRYFAVRNENREYRGTLEVSQDITEARELTGERRLLNWPRVN